ncbi:MAG: Asparagine synthase (Glutamine-hydrolyzing) [Candidatus Gottesmanbacteria bacterium GW2011_GWB1_49_7]|uniref:Asparagine synthase (Glutamine-hydrolyzing) n=1 Tax=Candidatus Gottesmanbacteria bacterium GW2011_GWB1_49_7 TaxID=1618448 RepID=A0A0G1VW59_9BACT|nr:MAG: Asparagine synthase (Glutamine-hydrolyzing) [Candidatus Gottesmanbacteria bacterium GW2011_GWB1_49_7]
MKVFEFNGIKYARLPIKTHKIDFGEDLSYLLEKYARPELKKGDWVAISEKVVSVCQNNVRHLSTVKAGWLAKLIVKGVKKYPNDIGFSRPEKMQVAVERSGRLRMIAAMILGALGRVFGIHGVFWIIAGNRISEIDGFNPDAMYPYTEYVMLPPDDPGKICQKLEDKLGYPIAIVDGNNINVKVIAQSRRLPLDKKMIRLILLDNPLGQDQELTPFLIVRKV